MEFSDKNCLTEAELYGYISGQGSAPSLKHSESHLATCASCRRELAGLLKVLNPENETDLKQDSEPSQAELDHGMAIIKGTSPGKSASRKRIPGWLQWPVAAAAAIGFIVLGFLGLSRFSEYRKSQGFYSQARGFLEQNYAGVSPGNLRLSLPFTPTSKNRDNANEETLRRAENLLFQALAVREGMVEAHLGLGYVYLHESKFARARDEFQKALTVRKEHMQALLGRGVVQFEEGMHDPDPLRRDDLLRKAIGDFDAVLKLDADSAEARYNKVWALYNSGMHKEALREIDLYLSHDPLSDWAGELRSLKIKIQTTRTSAVGNEILRSARERDESMLRELARAAPYHIPGAILIALRLSLEMEEAPSVPGEPNSKDLQWAAKILEESYGDYTGDHSLKGALAFYAGLSPPQRALKKALDSQLQALSIKYRNDKLTAILQISTPLEHQYAELKDFWQLSSLYHLRGNSYYLGQADFESAGKEFRKMLDMANRLDSPDLTAKALGALATISGMQRKFDESLDYANRLKNLAQKYRLESYLVYACMTMGNQYNRMGQFEESLLEYSAALEMSYRLLDGSNIIVTLERLGQAMDRLGRYQEARTYYIRAVQKHDEYLKGGVISPSPETISRRLNLMCKQGELALRAGDFVTAETSFGESLKSTPPGMSELEGRIRLGLAELYLKTNRISEAEGMLKSLRAINRSGQYPDVMWRAKSLEGKLLQRNGNRREALVSFRQSIDILERMRKHITPEDLRFSFFTDRYDPFRMVVSLLYESGGDQRETLAFVDRAKSLTLKEHLQSNGLASAASVPSKGIQEGKNPFPTVEYFFAEDALLIFSTSGGRTETVSKRISKTELSGQIRNFLESIRSNDSKTFIQTSRLLYDELIAPVEKSVFAGSPETLVILPDGPLHLLPFAGLQDGHGRFLIEKTPVAFAPSRSIFQHCMLSNCGRTNGNHTALLIDGSAGLPNAREELAYLSRLYSGNASVLSPEDLPSFGKAASRSGILHFAGHAESIRGKPVLMLRPAPREIYLDCQAINRWRMPQVQLVNLAGCNTAAGPLSEGEAPWGLIPAFLNAGAPAIIASLMPVGDLCTKHLTLRFYDLLKKGSGKALALQQAQIALLNTARSGSNINPRSWIPFILVGNPT